MIIVSQDKDLILNFKNIDAIGIGNPLEYVDGMFKVFASTTSDNEYTLGRYSTEERGKEVLEEIMKKYLEIKCFYNSKYEVMQDIEQPKVFEMPVEKVDDK